MSGSLSPAEAIRHEPQTSVALPTRKGPSPEDWERHQVVIQRLYLDENRPLKNVMSIMAEQYGHKATVKMYKARITKWKLDKKNKEHEMVAILRKKMQRDAVDKPSAFRLRGRPVDVNDVLRYLKRKRVPLCRVAMRDTSTPSDICCWTPQRMSSPGLPIVSSEAFRGAEPEERFWYHQLAGFEETVDDLDLMLLEHSQYQGHDTLEVNSIPRPMTPPLHLLLSEQLFANIRIYISWSIGNKPWISDEIESLTNIRSLVSYKNYAGKFISFCDTSRLLFRSQSFDSLVAGRRMLSKAFGLIKYVLTEEDPFALENLLNALFRFMDTGHEDIATMLRQYISQMAAEVLPLDHPLYHICSSIGSDRFDDFRTLCGRIWEINADTVERELGSFHYISIKTRTSFLSAVVAPMDPSAAERQLRKLLLDYEIHCERLCETTDHRWASTSLVLGQILLRQGKYTEAEVLGKDILARSLNSQLYKAMALDFMANSQYFLDGWCLAVKYKHEAIDMVRKSWDRTNPWCIVLMAQLEGWLRQRGQEREADNLRAEIIELVGPDDFDEELPTSQSYITKPASLMGQRGFVDGEGRGSEVYTEHSTNKPEAADAATPRLVEPLSP